MSHERKNFRRSGVMAAGMLAVLVPEVTWGHYWFQKATVNPTSVIGRSTPTTSGSSA